MPSRRGSSVGLRRCSHLRAQPVQGAGCHGNMASARASPGGRSRDSTAAPAGPRDAEATEERTSESAALATRWQLHRGATCNSSIQRLVCFPSAPPGLMIQRQLTRFCILSLIMGRICVGVYRQSCSGIPLAVRFVGRDRLLWNSMVQGTQRFRQGRATSCVIPYVLCGCLYCLRC